MADEAGTAYAGCAGAPADPLRIYAVDLESGTVKATASVASTGTAPGSFVQPLDLVLDDARGRLVVVPGYCSGCAAEPPPLIVLDANTLAVELTVAQSAIVPLGPLGIGPLGIRQYQRTEFDLNGKHDAYFAWTTRGLVTTTSSHPDPMCINQSLTRVDAATRRVTERVDIWARLTALQFGGNARGCPSFERLQLTTPGKPRLLATTQGRSVTFTWDDPGDAAYFDIEVGSAPGLRNLLVSSVEAATFTATDVPPGTYFVRVRGINDIGRSLPSNEVVVVVQ